MSLTSRISLIGTPLNDPEDFLSDSLGVVFPDDVNNQHGDAQHALQYSSPYLPKPLSIQLGDPDKQDDRLLFAHYLWNASLMLAEFVEAGTLGLDLTPELRGGTRQFDVKGLETLEVGAGTALPSMMSALLGAKKAIATDYPAAPVMSTLRKNVAHNVTPEFSPTKTAAPVIVEGHSWGELETPFAKEHKAAFDRIFVCDCLWMPWQHSNLRKSIAWFMKKGSESRACVIAGFHSGRDKMQRFFDNGALAAAGLELESIWERDCDGVERDFLRRREGEDSSTRKRWLAVAILRRTPGG